MSQFLNQSYKEKYNLTNRKELYESYKNKYSD